MLKEAYHVFFFSQYHGGTNFGRTAGGPFITTSYDYDAPIDEYGENIYHVIVTERPILWFYQYNLWFSYASNSLIHDFDLIGLIRQPKYGHLKELHKAIKLCELALLSADPAETTLGTYAKVCHHFDFEAT